MKLDLLPKLVSLSEDDDLPLSNNTEILLFSAFFDLLKRKNLNYVLRFAWNHFPNKSDHP